MREETMTRSFCGNFDEALSAMVIGVEKSKTKKKLVSNLLLWMKNVGLVEINAFIFGLGPWFVGPNLNL